MSSLVIWVWLALALDALLGDPRWLPHPVRLIGRAALALEAPLRRWVRKPKLAGILAALLVIGGTGAVTWGVLLAARSVTPLLGDVVSVLFLYTTFAAKDLAAHSRAVFHALDAGDLPQARRRVARMVGRDTEGLDEAGIVRAAVESVAENSVDGVLAPVFYAFLFGPVGAMVYKTVSTLDSTFGYKNKRYIDFGWASARIDDAANYIPARLSLALIPLGALLTGASASEAWRIGVRDARKHASPNSGHSEAAFAGALNVQLGGPLFRHGKAAFAPLLGDLEQPLARDHIRQANALLFAVTGVAALLFTGIRIAWRAGLS